MAFSITILEGPEKGKKYSFDRVQITIGRTMENDVVLPDRGISRQHVYIRDKGGAYILKDLGSSNGTFLNGKRVEQEVLSAGDIISIGQSKIRFDGPIRKAQSQAMRKQHAATDRRAAPAPVRARGRTAKPADNRRARTAARAAKPKIESPGLRKRRQPQADGGAGALGKQPAASGDRGSPIGAALAKLEPLKRKFLQLDKRLRMAILTVGAFLLVVILFAVFKGGKEVVKKVVDHSEDVFEVGLTDSDGVPASFGVGGVTYLCRTAANFKIHYSNGRVTMKLQLAAIDQPRELSVLLNGIEFKTVPPPVARMEWIDLKWDLPRKHLAENKENILSFVNNINSEKGSEDLWGVRIIELKETPLPNPDRKLAEQNFELARKKYEGRNISPENLYLALKYYKAARDYLELLPEDQRPSMYQEAVEMVEKVTKELDKKYRSLVFEAERSVQYGNYKRAMDLYHQILKAIPNTEDPRHQTARTALDNLEQM